jgi:hypothetical protein
VRHAARPLGAGDDFCGMRGRSGHLGVTVCVPYARPAVESSRAERLSCEECGREQADGERGWKAYRTFEEDEPRRRTFSARSAPPASSVCATPRTRIVKSERPVLCATVARHSMRFGVVSGGGKRRARRPPLSCSIPHRARDSGLLAEGRDSNPRGTDRPLAIFETLRLWLNHAR